MKILIIGKYFQENKLSSYPNKYFWLLEQQNVKKANKDIEFLNGSLCNIYEINGNRWNKFKNVKQIHKFCLDNKIDLVIFFGNFLLLYDIYKFSKLNKIPVIFSLHFRKKKVFKLIFAHFRYFRKKFGSFFYPHIFPDFLIKFFLNNSNIITTISPSLMIKNFLSTLNPKISHYQINAPLDFDLIEKKKELYKAKNFKTDNPNIQKIILYLGDTGEERGVNEIFQSVPKIIEKNNKITFVFLFRKLVFEDAKKGGLNKFKNLIGKLPQNNIRIIYKNVDVFYYLICADLVISPFLSIYQTEVPYVVLEAMAMRKLVVTTPVNAVSEIIRDGYNGIFLKKVNANNISDKIFEFIDNSDRKYAIENNARSYIFKNHNLYLLAKEFNEILWNATN